MMTPLRWLFADQLGPAFDDGGEAVVILARSAFARRRMHRAKALLLVSAAMHRADADERVRLVIAEDYRSAVAQLRADGHELEVVDPTSHAARRLVRELGVGVLPSRGFLTSEEEFATWARGRKRLVLEDFYRWARRRSGVLMDGYEPADGRWNFDAENRLPPPKGRPGLGLPVAFPAEDEVDTRARALLAEWEAGGVEFRGSDGPRNFAVTRAEALAALEDFITHRLAEFGPYEDADSAGDWVMAHSLLSVPMNLGLLHPGEAVEAVEAAWRRGDVPLNSAEGFIRQVMGWRDYVWHLYWWFGEDYPSANALSAHEPLPDWFAELEHSEVKAACLSHALEEVDQRGWAHHIVRLMVLGNWALQRGYDPAAVNRWFTEVFVDGFEWVMPANVIGMALYADGGRMATKPYAAGGAYLNRMTDHCRGCVYKPTERVGPRACPFTAGYWWFLHRNAEVLGSNHRLAQPYATLSRLAGADELVAVESARGQEAP